MRRREYKMQEYFYFNDESCEDYDVIIAGNPDIEIPEDDTDEITIPGRDGSLFVSNGRKEPITISLECDFISDSKDEWWEAFRKVKSWLTGSGTLQFDDDGDYFYNVLQCTASGHKRQHWKLGTFTVKFTCIPYMYLSSGLTEYDYTEVLTNQYDVCHPIYNITGVGSCTLTVNGNAMTAWVTSNLTIDTERMIAYTDDGEVSNTAVSGNYDELYLESGTNTITITSGFTLTVIPNWRCL